jgi:hypothetical protein
MFGAQRNKNQKEDSKKTTSNHPLSVERASNLNETNKPLKKSLKIAAKLGSLNKPA